MFKDHRFAYLVPGQYDVELISSTKVNIQCHNVSLFEQNINIDKFNEDIQDKLSIGSELANVTIKPRETVYIEFNAALEDLDQTVKSPKQIQEILSERTKEYWRNKLIFWVCNKIKGNGFSLSDINVAFFFIFGTEF